jgi:hypothetical protein
MSGIANLGQLTTGYFSRWVDQFPGKFLVNAGDGLLRVDRVFLIDHARKLSTGEQVYAALWWEMVVGRPAPWLADDVTALGLALQILDADYRQSIVELLTGLHHLRVADRR